MSIYDAPNQEVVGVGPPWVEGTGGVPGTLTAEPAADETEPEPGPAVDLDSMTKDQLLGYAQELGVSPANNAMTKDELRAGIDDKLAGR